MAKSLIQNIAVSFKGYFSNVLLIENNDKFLYRADVIRELKAQGIYIFIGNAIQSRVQFELREPDSVLVLLSQNKNNFLEDIKNCSFSVEFFLDQFITGYHTGTLLNLELDILDKLHSKEQFVTLGKKETLQEIEKFDPTPNSTLVIEFNLEDFVNSLDTQLNYENINWGVVSRIISNAILKSIGTNIFDEVIQHVNKANELFQINLVRSYKQLKNTRAVKKPQIVSKILEYIDFNFKNEKIALIVIDGLAFWQYEILKSKIPGLKNEEVIYSWIPSITQLSRQAIFKGGVPDSEYKQNPKNEENLWKIFWREKGIADYQIRYAHGSADLINLSSVTKFGIVFTELDEKMHSSTDYNDLLKLTENWIVRNNIQVIVQELLDKDFKVFLTTDHGNIEAKGWRGLSGREKMGTNKSGSRSERHIEYSDQWLADEFMQNNTDLNNSVVNENHAIYFKSDLSFSNKEKIVTHGGAHLLEVLIPFVEIKNDK
jgi:hypothetical protein